MSLSATVLKQVHVTCVSLTLAGFVARGLGAFAQAAWVRARGTRVASAALDTVLLVSAIALALVEGISPLVHSWLAAKIVGLLAYIGLGVVALRPGIAWPTRLAAWVGALGVFAYILSVAVTKDPLGLLP